MILRNTILRVAKYTLFTLDAAKGFQVAEDPEAPAMLLYGGDEAFTHRGISASSWRTL